MSSNRRPDGPQKSTCAPPTYSTLPQACGTCRFLDKASSSVASTWPSCVLVSGCNVAYRSNAISAIGSLRCHSQRFRGTTCSSESWRRRLWLMAVPCGFTPRALVEMFWPLSGCSFSCLGNSGRRNWRGPRPRRTQRLHLNTHGGIAQISAQLGKARLRSSGHRLPSQQKADAESGCIWAWEGLNSGTTC